MEEFWEWLTQTKEGCDLSGALVVGGIGLLFYAVNWAIFFHNRKPDAKWSSMTPPLGGLLIALAFLIFAPGSWKFFALLGLTDPCVLLIVHAIVSEASGKERGADSSGENNMKETDENGKHD